MLLMQKLKALEKQIIFLRWATGEAIGKLQYVGNDFIEFITLNEYGQYEETVLLRPNLILEVVMGNSEINKVIAELSHKLSINENHN